MSAAIRIQRRIQTCAAVGFSIAAAAQVSAQWPAYAGDAARSSIAQRAPRDLTRVAWSVQPDEDEEFVARSTPVAWGGRVFVLARLFEDGLHVANRLIAYAARDGTRLWSTPLTADVSDSWSSPVVDVRNRQVVVCSDRTVYALSVDDGGLIWQTSLDRPVVNASPLVTTDVEKKGTPANRVLISDSSGFAAGGRLYAINVDPFDAANNPYAPGQIAWSVSMDRTNGNSPAYENGVVYACSTSGRFKALEAAGGTLLWDRQIDLSGYPPLSGFYGGLAVRNGSLYAAIYVFFGGQNNSALFKLDAADGQVIWSTPCERTDGIPIVLDDGRIFLSGGIGGDFGSFNKIQAFQDHGATATMLWDTHADTAGGLEVGGWTHQPAYSRGLLLAGRPDDSPQFGAAVELYVLDTALTPAAPGFVRSQHGGAGGSPAAAHGRAYSIGTDGLLAFEPSAECLADLDGSGSVGIADLSALLTAFGQTDGQAGYDAELDVDLDGLIGLGDLSAVLSALGTQCP